MSSPGNVVLGGPLFEVGVVLLFVIMAMSALVSFFQEMIVQIFRMRSKNLRNGITQLLSDRHYKDEIAKRFYRHPMITALGKSGSRVTHIEPETFIAALATAIQPAWSKQDPVSAMPSSVAALDEGELKHRLSLVIPPAESNPDRELILASAKTWFDTSINKISHRYKADAVALSYIIAASLTVFLNVSPIEISQRLMTDNALRTSFASVVPELSTLVFNTGQRLPVASSADDAAAAAAERASGASALSAGDVQTMLAVFQCSRNELSLPFGWPWMGDALDSLSGSKVARYINLPSEKDACAAAINRAEASPALRAKLGAAGQQTIADNLSPNALRQYGPDFATDNPALILIGWLVMVFAAAQGAPFWFDALKRMMRR